MEPIRKTYTLSGKTYVQEKASLYQGMYLLSLLEGRSWKDVLQSSDPGASLVENLGKNIHAAIGVLLKPAHMGHEEFIKYHEKGLPEEEQATFKGVDWDFPIEVATDFLDCSQVSSAWDTKITTLMEKILGVAQSVGKKNWNGPVPNSAAALPPAETVSVP